MNLLKNSKYLIAYLVPLSALASILMGGLWVFATFVLLFILVPILELSLPKSERNYSDNEESEKLSMRLFDILLYLNVPLIFGILVLFLSRVGNTDLFLWERLGMTLSMGILLGYGINVAHELGHRTLAFERFLSKLTLLPNLYMHFIIEHNLGHHKYVSTDRDPASSKKNQLLYTFIPHSIVGGYLNAWKIERRLLDRNGQSFFSIHNEMIRFALIQVAYLAGIWALFGSSELLWAILAAYIGVALLETVNYIEHYGLRRKELSDGVYEPVNPSHSWNSNHEMGRIMLYELTRHSDHHYKTNRKYQVLRHFDQSPQMPYGYPISILLAHFPALWFRIMNDRVDSIQEAKPDSALSAA